MDSDSTTAEPAPRSRTDLGNDRQTEEHPPQRKVITTDGSVSVTVGSVGDAIYKYIRRLVDSGAAKGLKAADALLLLVSLRFIYGKQALEDGKLYVFPTVRQLRAITGRSRGTLTDSRAKLVQKGFLRLQRLGGDGPDGTGRGSVYELLWPPDVSSGEEVWATPGLFPRKTPRPKTRTGARASPDRGARQPGRGRAPGRTLSNRGNNKTNSLAASSDSAAAAKGVDERGEKRIVSQKSSVAQGFRKRRPLASCATGRRRS